MCAARNGDNQIINRFTQINEDDNKKEVATKRLISLVDSVTKYLKLLDRHFSEVIEKLLDLGADCNVQDQNHETPFSKMLAKVPLATLYDKYDTLSESVKIIKQFVLRRADLNIEVKYSSRIWEYHSSTPLIMLLRSIGVCGTASNREDIIKLVQILIGSGVDVNAPDSSGEIPINEVLYCYGKEERITALRLLLEAGAKGDARTADETVEITETLYSFNNLKKYVENGLKVIGLLIDYGTDTSGLLYKTILKAKGSILVYMKLNILTKLSAFLIRHGIDINEKTEDKTCLMLSRDIKMKPLENLLLGAGAIDPEK
jgi:ankyrin repeat protein